MARRRPPSPGPYLLHVEMLRERVPDARQYPFCLPAIRGLDRLAFHPKVTFFVGENGSGKSTLLEAIAVEYGLNPEGGSRNFNFATRASHSQLCDAIRIAKAPRMASDSYFLRAESFHNVGTEIEELDKDVPNPYFRSPRIIDSYGGISLHEQSHGESFFALFRNRFHGYGLYFLDEPEAALSPKRQLEFLAILHSYCKRGSQFVIATHSPIIMAYPESCIYHFSTEGIQTVAYTETEHYLVTRGFLTNTHRMLAELLQDETNEKPAG